MVVLFTLAMWHYVMRRAAIGSSLYFQRTIFWISYGIKTVILNGLKKEAIKLFT